jgi:hypothetical protein
MVKTCNILNRRSGGTFNPLCLFVETSVVDPDPESDPDPELFAGSGSGINHFGSGSALIPNFSVKKSHFFNQIAQKI